MLGDLRGEFVEVVGQLNLAAQRPERLLDGTAALDCDQSRDGAAGALNDDLFAALGKRDQPRQLALGFMHSDADHDDTIARA
jgi:hypothetical protein